MKVAKSAIEFSKALVVRINLKKAEEGYNFAIEVLKKTAGISTEDLLSINQVRQRMADMYRTSFSTNGSQRYDPEDRPFKLSEACNQTVDKINGEDNQLGAYARAKALAMFGKAHVAKKLRDKAEELLLKAQTLISGEYGED